MQCAQLIVVLPLGPDHNVAYVSDTLDSITRYATPARKFILIDDSAQSAGARLQSRFPEIQLIENPRPLGPAAGLYLTVSKGIEYACKSYAFELLLKLDADALLVGQGFENQAAQIFREDLSLGSIGSHKIDCMNLRRDFSHHNNLLFREICDAFLIMNPQHAQGINFLRDAFQKARALGYSPGEHCQGGAYFLSHACAMRLLENNLLSQSQIAFSGLDEDSIFGLLIHSLGLKLGDFATGSLPMGLRWRGLPCSPQELLDRNKKIIHSVRFYQNLAESDIRQFFKDHRN